MLIKMIGVDLIMYITLHVLQKASHDIYSASPQTLHLYSTLCLDNG